MSGQSLQREFFRGSLKDTLHLTCSADTDRVGNIDLVAAQIAHASDHIRCGFWGDFTLIRTTQRTANAATQAHAVLLGGLCDIAEAFDRFRDRAIDILLRKSLRCGAKDHDLIHLCCQCRVKTLHVRHQRRVDRARSALNALHDLGRRRHLWHPFWRHERDCLDIRNTRIAQSIHQVDLYLGRDRLFFILQAIARADLDNFYRRRQYRSTHRLSLCSNDSSCAPSVT